jgi:protein-S-isoprenylcysteine O-methyltransferase Ste14
MLITEMPKQGAYLFRYRSYIPILMIVPMLIGSIQFLNFSAHDLLRHEWWSFACFGISLSGLVLRSLVVAFVPHGTSGRNQRKQIAAVLNTTGMYSIVRHPLYVGNFLIWLGIMACFGDAVVTLLFLFAFGFYYERIMAAEEEFLAAKFGRDYYNWAEKTPACIPRPSLWKAPNLQFCFRNILRREYCALLGITLGFSGIDLVVHLLALRKFEVDLVWFVVLIVGTSTFLILRWLKKHTRLLHVQGR